jgi:hypothetical protein
VNAGRQSYVFTFLPIKGLSGTSWDTSRGSTESRSGRTPENLPAFCLPLLLFFATAALLLYQALRSHSKLVDEAIFDSLTGALKKAEFEALAKSEADRANGTGFPFR